MDKTKVKRRLKLALRILIAVAAIYFVVREIDLQETKRLILSANFGWLLLATLFFNASKILSAFRLNYFFKSLGLDLEWGYNLKLYYVGMFYNLFLPGGIGGDGYKVYLLNKRFKTPVKGLITASLLDRVSGVVALGFLAFGLAIMGSTYEFLEDWSVLLWIGLILAFPLYYLGLHLFFKVYKKYAHTTNVQALGVQGLQVLCAYCILHGLGVETAYVDYLTLFLVTSVAAALPIALPGGIGIREYIFTVGYSYFLIDQSASVALATLFYLITLVSSFIGVFFDKSNKKEVADSQ